MASETIVALYLAPAAFAWWLFCWPYRRHRLARLRQDLFDLRDSLFDYALASETLDFSDPAYGRTRTIINGVLRFSGELSVGDMLVSIWLHRSSSESEKRLIYQREKERDAALASLDEPDREFVNQIRAAMHASVFAYLASTSMLLMPVFHPMKWLCRAGIFFGVAREHAAGWRRNVSARLSGLEVVKALDTEAQAIGSEAPAGAGKRVA